MWQNEKNQAVRDQMVQDSFADHGKIREAQEAPVLLEESAGTRLHDEDDDATLIDFSPEDLEPRAFKPPPRGRIILVLGVVAALLTLTLVPPLVNMNRFRRQIASSIGASLGRPVHMDSVTLNLLPMPGFTLENLVVTEDPAFGSEPVLRANKVTATLRASSLWRRRVEFSSIAFDETSLNLVHRADGRWNIESILLQASRVAAAPTAQREVGETPRFPYIEATNARLNVKMGAEKMPLSLTEAKFALWLPQPQQWRLRLEGHPTRTDTAATDTGLLRLEGTLGKATALEDVPLDLNVEWVNVPLGAASWVVMGRDAGVRGDLTARFHVRGTVGENAVEAHALLAAVRRADFVPERTLDAEITCRARASESFHRLTEIACAWPADGQGKGLEVHGEIPDVLHPETTSASAKITGVPAAALLDGLRVLSSRVSPALQAGGVLDGSVECCRGADGQVEDASLDLTQAKLTVTGAAPFLEDDVQSEWVAGQLVLRPVALNLGAPAPALLEGRADAAGYGMHLSGMAMRSRLLLLAQSLPPFGDGLAAALPAVPNAAASTSTPPAKTTPEAPMRIDLQSSGSWSGGQVWTATPVKSGARPTRVRRR